MKLFQAALSRSVYSSLFPISALGALATTLSGTLTLLVMILATKPAHAALVAGDIAIIGVSADGPDEFSWVPLVNLSGGQVIYFSNVAYDSGSQAFRGAGDSQEWLLQYAVPAGGLAAGSRQLFLDSNGNGIQPDYSGGYTLTDFGALNTAQGNISLSASGDQLLAFTSSDDPTQAGFGQQSFTALFSLDSGLGGNEFSYLDNYSTYTTDLPPGLTEGETALALSDAGIDEWDNMRYIGPATGSREALLAAIANPANWEAQDDTVPQGWSAAGAESFTVLNAAPLQETTPVPIPAALWMLLSGLVTLLVTRKGASRLSVRV